MYIEISCADTAPHNDRPIPEILTQTENEVTGNGWHRFLIVIAAGWVLAVTGLAALEYHAGQGQAGDGFFTCAEPAGPPTPPSTRYWSRDCGLFPRVWVSKGLFDDLPPHVRYLNVSWFLAVLLGPPAFILVGMAAILWVMQGFRGRPSGNGNAELTHPGTTQVPARSEIASLNHAQAWLDQMPRRWARNAAVGNTLFAAFTIMFLSKDDGTAITFMLFAASVVGLGAAAAANLCGRWARFSLKASFLTNPASAISRITPNWVMGAILLGTLLLTSDLLFGWRTTTPFEPGLSYRNSGYLTGFFGTWMLGGYLTALVSKRGLRKAIGADLEHKRKAESPTTSYCLPFQTIG